mmetsp:Transcript_62389/g.52908  ORF Transcript_62389/g.52908 Transcript_62389/m.52908 type:complete len:86 (+) Transcript_62389:286-543(+)
MRTIDERQFNNDILVAKSTNPGWTSLIIRAKAVLLQTGGSLQHGACLSRELGLPCIVGLEDIFFKFENEEKVEIDAVSGIVSKIV